MAGEPSTSTTFVGITASGGSAAFPGRFEVDSFPNLRDKIIGDETLDDTVTNDSPDPDEFIDPGLGYDLTLALRNSFVLEPGQSATYMTQTLFGSGAPEEFAELSLTKTDSPDPVEIEQNLTYTATITNSGPNAATGVALTDTLPTDAIFVSATPSQGSCTEASGIVTCNLDELANGASATVTVVVIPTAPGTITNTASITSDVLDPDTTNNRATASTTVGSLPLQFSDGTNSLTVNTATGEFIFTYAVDGVPFLCSGAGARVDEGFLTISDRCREDSRDPIRAVGPTDSGITVELIDYSGAAASDRIIRHFILMPQ
jgi:uncharacterized repeat protein (TIGR01451 family)